MATRLLAGVLLALLLGAAPVQAETARSLTLAECQRLAIAQNPAVAGQKLAARVGAIEQAIADHRYGFSLLAGPTVERQVKPTAQTFLSGGVSQLNEVTQDYNVALKHTLMTGGAWSLGLSTNWFETNSQRVDFNPAVRPELALSFSQPLLRTWWAGGREIELATLEAQAARWRLEDQLSQLALDTELAYWDWVAAREALQVRERAIRSVAELVSANRQKARAGVLAPVDVLQAEATLAVRQGDLLEAQRAVALAEDRVRALIGARFTDAAWQTALVPLDAPRYTARRVAFDTAWATARTQRPDLKLAASASDKQAVALNAAANQLLPRLDVTGKAGTNSLDPALNTAVGKIGQLQNYTVQAGVVLEWPLGPNANQDGYEKARLQKAQAEADQEAVLQTAFVQVREAVRDVAIFGQRVEATRAAQKLAEANLAAEQKKLAAGMSTNFQVLVLQKDRAEAALAASQAVIRHLQAVARLDRVQGTLLASRRLTPVEAAPMYTVPQR